MNYINTVNSIQLEIGSNCNLTCTGCARINKEDLETTTPLLKKNIFLDINLIKELLNSKYLQNLDYIDFCGSVDDPLMHPKFLDIIDYITNKGIKIIVQTNASLRSTEYWKSIASILKKNTSSYVKFSVDGLEDTNHLYRRGSNWNKIMDNARAYIKEGGRAQWQYIVFPWNAHQVEDARKLSQELGFESFRYRHDRGNVPSNNDEKEKAIKRHFDVLNMSWDDFSKLHNKKATDDEVCCYAREEQQFFITHNGLVWPCCFLHNAKYKKFEKWKEYTDRFDLNYKKDWNNLYYNSFDDIFNHEFYQNNLVKSWESTTHGSGKYDRLIRCTQTCSKKTTTMIPHLVVSNKLIHKTS
jgi:MoaA/NifB/PqqE/SkfB family radical SAM enzyme